MLVAVATMGQTYAQQMTCDCKSDIQYLNERIEKTPAYKAHKKAYAEAYKTALQISAQDDISYNECFEILNRLLIPLQDWHMGIYEKAADSLTISSVTYPKVNYDLDSLKLVLHAKPFESIEGVYYGKEDLTIGVVKDGASDAYRAVILHTHSDIWEKGTILYQYISLPNNFLKTMGAQYPNKRLISYYERNHDGMMLRSGLKKDTTSTTFERTPYPESTYLIKEVSPTIDYLKIGSFSSRYPLLREAENFYASLEGQLKKEHLIVDLRDNGGGGNRNSNILLKQLKKYLKTNKVYIITNATTASNAEQFAIKLKSTKKAMLFGDKTSGTLSYEIKPDDYHYLPSSDFLVVLTSKAHKQFRDYETKGIDPDVLLDYDKSWIAQVEDFILNER